ncbi:MAG: tRNA (adenosine(37)-N6)-threonylcarbamoyltransferase complex dimerization subunit type 1 TsaB [Planctomycetaceae bacterium]|nr:tRNA (adenosine(37)-N6)-threonylcarbamoyltransferase complex dimerization subunit type 1 TsaB [Planctomycetaceae bacterium]
MLILALETSGLQGSIALSRGGVIVSRQLAREGRRHAQTLTLEIHELLRDQQVAPQDLDAVAVSLGPGSFTGLRVGLVCAKTLAYALQCRLVGVETYQAVATCAAAHDPTLGETGSRLLVVGDAQRGDMFLAEYVRHTDRGWMRQGEHRIVPAETWLAALEPADIVIGPGVTRVPDGATRARVIREPWSIQPSAASICELAQSRITLAAVDDPWTLAPIYLRPSAAEEQRDLKDAQKLGG